MSTPVYIEEMKKPFYLRMEESSVSELARIAKTYDMEANAYGAMVLARFADLKPEFALHALTAIPKEYFRATVGRPTATTTRTQTDTQKVA
jgi:hypothetical protein